MFTVENFRAFYNMTCFLELAVHSNASSIWGCLGEQGQGLGYGRAGAELGLAELSNLTA